MQIGRRRTTLRGALTALALACAASATMGCYVARAQSRPLEVGATTAPVARPFDGRLVDPAFENALARFIRDLDAVQGRRGDLEDVEVRRTLRQLSLTVEKVPYADGIDVSRGRQAIRGGHRGGVGSHEGSVAQGLEGISTTLTELAQGPYREVEPLLGLVYACDESVRGIARASTARGSRMAAVVAMEKAEAALLEMRAAVGRSQVTGPVKPPVTRWGNAQE